MSSPLSITEPTVGGDTDTWGTKLNTAITALLNRLNGHAQQHQNGGFDALSLDASQIATGTVGTARLGSGSASSSTFLRGDNTWAAAGGMTDPTTTKGDLIVHGATTTRLAVGSDAQVLTADSSQAAGVKWATPSSGAPIPTNYLAATGALYETLPRQFVGSGSDPLTSGRLTLYAIQLPTGLTIGHLGFGSNRAAALPTHWWFGLYDSSRVQLAVTADQTSTAWASQEFKSLAIATIASGAASSFTTTYTGLYYLGIMMAASNTTVAPFSNSGNSTFWGPVSAGGPGPALTIGADTGLTTPPAFPFTAALNAANANLGYGYVLT